MFFIKEKSNTKIWVKLKKKMRKKSEAGILLAPNFIVYYKSTVIRTVCYWHKKRHINQWNAIENPDINSHTSMANWFYTRMSRLFNK